MLPQIDEMLIQLAANKDDPTKYACGHGYWDDLCLARFLEGICLRYIAYPVSHISDWNPAFLTAVLSGPRCRRGSFRGASCVAYKRRIPGYSCF